MILRARYAVSGTDIAYGQIQSASTLLCPVQPLLASYVPPILLSSPASYPPTRPLADARGTEMGYGGTRPDDTKGVEGGRAYRALWQ
eukprot:2529810-Rhodomonas_salina.1